MGNFQRSSGLLLAAAERGELDVIQWTEIDVGGGLLVAVLQRRSQGGGIPR